MVRAVSLTCFFAGLLLVTFVSSHGKDEIETTTTSQMKSFSDSVNTTMSKSHNQCMEISMAVNTIQKEVAMSLNTLQSLKKQLNKEIKHLTDMKKIISVMGGNNQKADSKTAVKNARQARLKAAAEKRKEALKLKKEMRKAAAEKRREAQKLKQEKRKKLKDLQSKIKKMRKEIRKVSKGKGAAKEVKEKRLALGALKEKLVALRKEKRTLKMKLSSTNEVTTLAESGKNAQNITILNDTVLKQLPRIKRSLKGLHQGWMKKRGKDKDEDSEGEEDEESGSKRKAGIWGSSKRKHKGWMKKRDKGTEEDEDTSDEGEKEEGGKKKKMWGKQKLSHKGWGKSRHHGKRNKTGDDDDDAEGDETHSKHRGGWGRHKNRGKGGDKTEKRERRKDFFKDMKEKTEKGFSKMKGAFESVPGKLSEVGESISSFFKGMKKDGNDEEDADDDYVDYDLAKK